MPRRYESNFFKMYYHREKLKHLRQTYEKENSVFFENELETNAIGHLELISSSYSKKTLRSDLRTDGDTILELLNPFYFLEWLTFSLKDVF